MSARASSCDGAADASLGRSSSHEIPANLQATFANIRSSVLERELVIRDSRSAIAESKRLLEETQRLRRAPTASESGQRGECRAHPRSRRRA
jgi:hypothetical protein